MSGVVPLLKSVLPRGAQQTLRAIGNYGQRVAVWRSILRQIRGHDARDRAVLRRSALASPISAWGDFLVWRDPVLLHDATVDVAGVGTFDLHGHSDELYIVLPAREPAVFAALDRFLQPGDTFVDAGANIGVFSVYAARRVGRDGRIVAIEMMPQTAARLRAHLALNRVSTAHVIEAALSDRAGEMVSATIQPGHAGRATLTGALAAGLVVPDRFEVSTATLADILAGHDDIALMKIDVEGAELAALRGAGPALARIGAIVFEQLEDQDALSPFLTAAGFDIVQIDHHNYVAVRRGRTR